MYLKNGRKPAYFTVYLENGRINVATDKGKTTHMVASPGGLNDGLWHAVVLVKRGKKLTVRVNTEGQMQVLEVRKRLGVTAPLYVGGVPDYIQMPSEVMV